MKSKKKNKSKHQLTNNPPIIFPIFEKGDLAWVLLQYKREQHQNPEQTFFDFLMNQGTTGLLLQIWFSVDFLFSSPEDYVCVWHGTTLSRAVQILACGFARYPVYTSLEPHVCLWYAERRARNEADFPALIACVLERLYVQKHIAAQSQNHMHLIFEALPNRKPESLMTEENIQFVFIPPETEAFTKSPAFETWQIYAHTPGIVAPSQDDFDALLDEWDFVKEKL